MTTRRKLSFRHVRTRQGSLGTNERQQQRGSPNRTDGVPAGSPRHESPGAEQGGEDAVDTGSPGGGVVPTTRNTPSSHISNSKTTWIASMLIIRISSHGI